MTSARQAKFGRIDEAPDEVWGKERRALSGQNEERMRKASSVQKEEDIQQLVLRSYLSVEGSNVEVWSDLEEVRDEVWEEVAGQEEPWRIR